MASDSRDPLVSVIVPVYNLEVYLDECLWSIRNQSHQSLEIIVVEDGSTDASASIAARHATEDCRIRLLQHARNLGLSVARNTGIESSAGEYLMFVDSDDVIDPRLVETVLGVSVRNSADVVVFGFTTFGDGEAPEIPGVPDASAVRTFQRIDPDFFSLGYFAWLKFIRADWFGTTGIRFPAGYCYEDHLFHWQLGLCAKHIVDLDWKPYCYRQRIGSITNHIDHKSLDRIDMYRMILESLQRIEPDEALARVWLLKFDALVRLLLLNIQPDLIWEAQTRLREFFYGTVINSCIKENIGSFRRLCYAVMLSRFQGAFLIIVLRGIKWLKS